MQTYYRGIYVLKRCRYNNKYTLLTYACATAVKLKSYVFKGHYVLKNVNLRIVVRMAKLFAISKNMETIYIA